MTFISMTKTILSLRHKDDSFRPVSAVSFVRGIFYTRDMKSAQNHTKPWWLWLIIVLSIGAVCSTAYVVVYAKQIKNDLSLRTSELESFPNVDDLALTPVQAKIVSILRAEYSAQPAGIKYSQGVNEPWCADFVSWVMKETGLPFENPHSGSWRIPGTMTLRDYFIAEGKWRPYGEGYVPKTGDIAIYDGNGPHGQHTNFVVRYVGGDLITVGGNEGGTIRRQDHALNDELKVIGFAEL